MAEGFLGRWSRRKEAVRQGAEVEAEPPPQAAPAPRAPQPAAAAAAPEPAADAPPPPTLADTEALTPASDFSRFVRPGVAPEVKNAALKKLFADPRFNLQDGLDVYIGDYSKPDPLPPALLRQLASAKFLRLFDEEEGRGAEAARERESVAQSALCTELPRSAAAPAPACPADADPDLRLQQDDAPGRDVPGPGAG